MKKLRCLCITLLTTAALTGSVAADLVAGPAIAGPGVFWILFLLAAVGLVAAICAHIINK